MDESVSPVMRRNDEYSLRRLSADSEPHKLFWGISITFG
ncbi:hypothetical protein F383_31105 [Gossypium arboreum]|uniref:Uncharacterized protein n=1 Tax=Gossypium arboreum TaxID=29729 RepID=A0A0B0N1V3_GOSAR|nr:hypothetical protein F383_31105 [Gossypium arboreum]